jgi:TonB-linked SusC/RagA family outer membrane protein
MNGEPLVGASVLVQGTTTGVTTDIGGNYVLNNLSAQSVLNFTLLGYQNVLVTVGAQTTINAVLEEEATQMDEVVVIGYGTVKRRDITGAVSSVSGNDLAAVPVSDVAQALQGKMAGVSISAVDGRPGANVTVRVRGGGSITQSNDPLFIVDGFPVSNMSDVPASQIETIDVLKDASSTAIYGARGANGVVIITTKSPKSEKLSISYNGYVQLKTPTGNIDVLDPYEFALINWEYASLNGQSNQYQQVMAIGAHTSVTDGAGNVYNNPGGINSYKTAKSYNWMKEMTENAFSQSHNVNLSGGSAKSKYSVDYTYVNNPGIRLNSGFTRSNVIAKLSQSLLKNLNLDLTARYVTAGVEGNLGGGRLTDMMKFTPMNPLGAADELTNNGLLGVTSGNMQWRKNPVAVIEDTYELRTRNNLRANGSLAWEIIGGLTARTEFSLGTNWTDNRTWSGPDAKDTRRSGRGGDASIQRSFGTNYTWTNTINWQVQSLSQAHSLNLLAGQELTGSDGNSITVRGYDYPISFDYNRAFAMMNQYTTSSTTNPSESGMDDPGRMASFFGRVMYTFKDRYTLNATFRADGSSNFAPSNRWGYFPSAAVAWRISEESFMKNFHNLDNLKLRVSYGTAGNDRITASLWDFLWSSKSDGYPLGGSQRSIYNPASGLMTNPNLKWETTVTRNLGLDWSFYRGRVFGTVEVYKNTTKDLLVRNSLPGYTGYSEIMDNVGQTSNKGIEISVGGDIVRKQDFRLSANFNISFNKTNVDALSSSMSYKNYSSGIGTSSAVPSNDYVFMVGQPVGLIRGFVSDGFYTTADFNHAFVDGKDVYTLKDGVPNSLPVLAAIPDMKEVHPGMMKLKKIKTGDDANNKTVINEADDCVIIGDTNPIHIGGFNLNLVWKRFDAMANFTWSYGNDVYNYTPSVLQTGGKDWYRNFAGASAGRYKIFELSADGGTLTRVTDPAKLDAMNVNATTYYPFHEFRVLTSEFVEDGSFLRLNNLTLGYTLSEKVAKKIYLSRLRVYVTGSNLFTITNYTGLDPEVNSGYNRNSSYPVTGMDYGTYPPARTYTLGLNLTF